MSAFAPAGVARVGLGESIVPVLQKPFDPAQLAELVALALEHPVAPRGTRGDAVDAAGIEVAAPTLRDGGVPVYLSAVPAWRRPVSEARGREARLRPEFDYLYPDIEPGVWQPVEVLINRVVTMLYGDRSRSGVITGERLLRDDHFEFRGASPRPAGLAAPISAG